MRHLVILAAVAAMVGAQLPADDECLVATGGQHIQNPDFEADTIDLSVHPRGYAIMVPDKWQLAQEMTGTRKVILVQSGASAWGGLVAASQRHFMSIKTDASLYQVLSGMQAGAEYSLTWYAAERPAYTENERFRVEIDDVIVADNINPPPRFVPYSVNFRANGSEVKLAFTNISPTGDHSFFLDNIQLFRRRDCGANAHCVSEPLERSYTCRCDHSYLGQPVDGGTATCTSAGSTLERLQALEDENAELRSRLSALERDTRAVKLATFDIQGVDVPAMLRTIQGLANFTTKLKEGLRAAPLRDVTGPESPQAAGSGDPEMTVRGGTLGFTMGEGRHVHVNGKPLPTADEVAGAIAGTLQDLAGDL